MEKALLPLVFALVGCGAAPSGNEPPPPEVYQTLENSDVVCEHCPPDELAQETVGIRRAAKAFIEYAGGSNLEPDYSPLTIHVSQDAACPPTSAAAYYRFPDICLFSYEGFKRYAPDSAPVTSVLAQWTFIHESLHAWFAGRVEYQYNLEEGFCRYVSYDASGAIADLYDRGVIARANACDLIADAEETTLVRRLCGLGLTSDHVRSILKGTDDAATQKGSVLTVREFADIVSGTMKLDANPAFVAAGLI